jgi:hypothetical protein
MGGVIWRLPLLDTQFYVQWAPHQCGQFNTKLCPISAPQTRQQSGTVDSRSKWPLEKDGHLNVQSARITISTDLSTRNMATGIVRFNHLWATYAAQQQPAPCVTWSSLYSIG